MSDDLPPHPDEELERDLRELFAPVRAPREFRERLKAELVHGADRLVVLDAAPVPAQVRWAGRVRAPLLVLAAHRRATAVALGALAVAAAALIAVSLSSTILGALLDNRHPALGPGPTNTPTITATPRPSATPTRVLVIAPPVKPTPTATARPTATPTAAPALRHTPTATLAPRHTPTATARLLQTPRPSATARPAPTSAPTPMATPRHHRAVPAPVTTQPVPAVTQPAPTATQSAPTATPPPPSATATSAAPVSQAPASATPTNTPQLAAPTATATSRPSTTATHAPAAAPSATPTATPRRHHLVPPVIRIPLPPAAPTATATPGGHAVAIALPSDTPSATATPSPTATASLTVTPRPSATATATATPTRAPSPTPTTTPRPSPTATPDVERIPLLQAQFPVPNPNNAVLFSPLSGALAADQPVSYSLPPTTTLQLAQAPASLSAISPTLSVFPITPTEATITDADNIMTTLGVKSTFMAPQVRADGSVVAAVQLDNQPYTLTVYAGFGAPWFTLHSFSAGVGAPSAPRLAGWSSAWLRAHNLLRSDLGLIVAYGDSAYYGQNVAGLPLLRPWAVVVSFDGGGVLRDLRYEYVVPGRAMQAAAQDPRAALAGAIEQGQGLYRGPAPSTFSGTPIITGLSMGYAGVHGAGTRDYLEPVYDLNGTIATTSGIQGFDLYARALS